MNLHLLLGEGQRVGLGDGGMTGDWGALAVQVPVRLHIHTWRTLPILVKGCLRFWGMSGHTTRYVVTSVRTHTRKHIITANIREVRMARGLEAREPRLQPLISRCQYIITFSPSHYNTHTSIAPYHIFFGTSTNLTHTRNISSHLSSPAFFFLLFPEYKSSHDAQNKILKDTITIRILRKLTLISLIFNHHL